jgi:TP53 regulating kinase-like protein
MMEWIEGGSLRQGLEGWLTAAAAAETATAEVETNVESKGRLHGHGRLKALMEDVGREIGKMHLAGVVHGDLTTSNILYTPQPPEVEGEEGGCGGLEGGDVTLIDFGLAAQSLQDEDRAVDLYVLERAFLSTHPKAEALLQEVLRGYEMAWEGKNGGNVVLRKLETVRMRGRKRSMLG